MSSLHISKVAVGCASIEALMKRQQSRIVGDHVPIVTRFRPKRADELIGGSIYWIVKHRIAARQTILGFAEREQDRHTIIRLDPRLVPVKSRAKRAHQGWRYLAENDAPPDFHGCEDGLERLPPSLVVKLSALALI